MMNTFQFIGLGWRCWRTGSTNADESANGTSPSDPTNTGGQALGPKSITKRPKQRVVSGARYEPEYFEYGRKSVTLSAATPAVWIGSNEEGKIHVSGELVLIDAAEEETTLGAESGAFEDPRDHLGAPAESAFDLTGPLDITSYVKSLTPDAQGNVQFTIVRRALKEVEWLPAEPEKPKPGDGTSSGGGPGVGTGGTGDTGGGTLGPIGIGIGWRVGVQPPTEEPAEEPDEDKGETYASTSLVLVAAVFKVYRPQEVQEAVTWNLTRKQKAIPDSEIEQKKVGIRVNKDGNDGGSENDLIEVEFASSVLEGFDLVIKRTSSKLKVFGSKDGTNIILDQNEVVVPDAMKPPRSYWVECTDDMPSGDIEFYIRSKSGGQDTKLKALPFRSFKTVVGALSGEVWDNAASAASQGIYKICEDLYLDGYNIHYFPESSETRCKSELKDQRDKCGINGIGVFGYSHGGGSTYNSTLFLGQVNYTGYIDAVRNNFFDINLFAEDRYPTGSSYHVNYYQSNWLTNPPLAGDKTKAPGANVEVDLTSTTKHDTIDDSPIVNSGIKSTLKGKIAP